MSRATGILTACAILLSAGGASAQEWTVVLGGAVGFGRADQAPSPRPDPRRGGEADWGAMTAGLRGAFGGDVNLVPLRGVVTTLTNLRPERRRGALAAHPNAVYQMAAEVGIDAFALADDHGWDYGWSGYRETQASFRQMTVALPTLRYAGIGKRDEAIAPQLFDRNGMVVALTSLGAPRADFQASRQRAGVLDHRDAEAWGAALEKLRDAPAHLRILTLHGGAPGPRAVDPEVAAKAREAVRVYGADIVVVEGAGAAKPIEVVDGRVILHGTGRLLDLSAPPAERLGAEADFGIIARIALRWSAEKGRLVPTAIRVVPVGGVDGRPAPLQGEEAARRMAALAAAGAEDAGVAALRLDARPDGSAAACLEEPRGPVAERTCR